MMAISNSRSRKTPPNPWLRRFTARFSLLLLVCAAAWNPARPAVAKGEDAPASTPAARAERAFSEARARFLQDSNNTEAAWQFARAAFDWAEFAPGNTARADLAEQGITACRQSLQQNPKLAPAHYYLAMNLGQLARTKGLSALQLVPVMETHFKQAIALEPAFDFAGPHRSLGLLYKDAPGWPLSIGSRNKARQHLQKAVELSPAYPDNRLSLLEVYLEGGDRKRVQAELPETEKALQAAREKLTGPLWEASWRDWDARLKEIKTKAGAGAKTLESPRNLK